MSTDTTRRAMLLELTGGLALLPAAALSERSPVLAAAPDERYWELARQPFDALRDARHRWLSVWRPAPLPSPLQHARPCAAGHRRVAALKSLIA